MIDAKLIAQMAVRVS